MNAKDHAEPALAVSGRLTPILEALPLCHATHAQATRRATLWRRFARGWRAVFHQGTVVTAA